MTPWCWCRWSRLTVDLRGSNLGGAPTGLESAGGSQQLLQSFLLVAAVLVSSQLGSETPDDSAEVAEDRPDPNAGDSPPEQTEVTEAPPADSAPTEQTDPDPAGDELTDDEDDQSAELSQAFGEPEHPVSGVEPYIPRRVRLDEPGPPADVCRGVLPALRIQLPLRFASTKPEGVDQLSWSPDCRRVVFRVGSTLWVADGDGTSDMPFLTAQHGLSSPSWSPDGEQIAFSQGAIVDGERASHVYVVQPRCSGPASDHRRFGLGPGACVVARRNPHRLLAPRTGDASHRHKRHSRHR